VAVADSNLLGAEETVQGIQRSGGQGIAIQVELRREDDIQRMVQRTVDTFGALHILFNNAGILAAGPVTDLDQAEWDRILDINLKAMYLTCKYAIPHLLRSGNSAIINTAASFGIVRSSGQVERGLSPAYCAAKAGVVGLTRSLARRHIKDGLRANVLCPGGTNSGLSVARAFHLTPLEAAQLLPHPRGRLAHPEEIARAALFLASDDATWVTGTELIVDGGQSI